MNFINSISTYLSSLGAAVDALDRREIDKFLDILMSAYDRGSRIFVFGNGGSAATASHFAGDLNKGVSYGLDKRFRVMPLTDNLASLTAYANDVSYDTVFVEQMKNFIEDGDIAIGISGSGNSKNVLAAIEYANGRGNLTVGITGYDGGKLKRIAAHSVNAGVSDMQIAEDIHMILAHLTMKCLCERLGTLK